MRRHRRRSRTPRRAQRAVLREAAPGSARPAAQPRGRGGLPVHGPRARGDSPATGRPGHRQSRDRRGAASPICRARTHADELMLTTVVYDHADRLRSYELVMAAMASRLGVGVPHPGPLARLIRQLPIARRRVSEVASRSGRHWSASSSGPAPRARAEPVRTPPARAAPRPPPKCARMVASATPSSIAWLAPWPTCGSIGCAASPSSVSRPLVQRLQRLAVVQAPPETCLDLGQDGFHQRVPAHELARQRRRIARRRPRLARLLGRRDEADVVEQRIGAHRKHQEVLARSEPVAHLARRPADARGGDDAAIRDRA